MIIGAHVSAAGGIQNAATNIEAIGGTAIQLFIAPPQSWRKTTITDESVAAFRAAVSGRGLGPVFIHALYLVNLATDNAELREKSIDALSYALQVADRIGAQGVIYHTGSRKARDQAEALRDVAGVMGEILRRAPGESQLIIENAAGYGGTLGDAFSELGEMLRAVKSPRVKVCFDTCHAFAAGYDIRSSAGVVQTLEEFDREVGVSNLVVIHANDSKFALGEGRDRHENLGEGYIGLDGFRALAAHPLLAQLPWILEVPGKDGNGPDSPNIEILRSLTA
ncbi:MAG: deoxyribonuclease IV [Patescibacteria group bacterium]